MFSLEIKTKEKMFLLTMSELTPVKESLALEYKIELKKSIKSIDPIHYNIVVDSRKLSSTQYSIVGEIMQLINEVPFKHIKVLC